jgi:hypothetical protein
MELESSSPYPQVPATCPYPEPTPSSPHEHNKSYGKKIYSPGMCAYLVYDSHHKKTPNQH